MTSMFASKLIASGALAVASPAVATQLEDTAAIEGVLHTYEKALNSQDTNAIVGLYAEDGVFMPQHSHPQVGLPAIREAYQRVFATITLNVDFKIDEITPLAKDWAFVRTQSEGTVKVNATGAGGPEGNQELFLFHRDRAGQWKIARYIFSTTNPPRP